MLMDLVFVLKWVKSRETDYKERTFFVDINGLNIA